MYPTLIFIHSWLRWGILILGIVVILKAYIGWIGNKKYLKSDNTLSLFLMALFHTQLVFGLLLYLFFSPITRSAFQDFGAAMKDSQLRYWAVEHSFIMILSVLIAQFGRIRTKKAHSALNKHRNTAIYFTMALILIVSRIPWDQATRLFRGFAE
jgi:heme A synthase